MCVIFKKALCELSQLLLWAISVLLFSSSMHGQDDFVADISACLRGLIKCLFGTYEGLAFPINFFECWEVI